MVISRLGNREYIRRSALEIEAEKFKIREKENELLLYENLRTIQSIKIRFYYDSESNQSFFIPYWKELSYR